MVLTGNVECGITDLQFSLDSQLYLDEQNLPGTALRAFRGVEEVKLARNFLYPNVIYSIP